ncbi:MAG: hypothetical protein K0Q59_5986 [Paenibacillus sp.]|jgi:hypothetical protein|nr:hypothetical protein [Paenibacillus sp.]
MITPEDAYVLARKYADRNEIPKVFLGGSTFGMTKETTKDLNLSYRSGSMNFDGVVSMKWQGSSSIGYPKKNFTIKMYTDAGKGTKLKKSFRTWGPQSKFCLKANYTDHSHARNIVSARLWGQMASTRQNVPTPMERSPNYGAIDGPERLHQRTLS